MFQENLRKDEVGLSLLEMISINDLEKQCTKIANWLKQYCSVEGVGFFLHDTLPHRKYIYTETVPKDIFEQLEGIISKIDPAEKTADGLMFFGQKQGQVAVFNIQAEQPPSTPMGLAIPLVAEEGCIGALSLAAEPAIIQNLKSEASGLVPLIPVITHLINNCILHEKKDKKIGMLNLYQSVSSLLAYVCDLYELLTTIVSVVTTEMNCEEGSVLLLDEDTHEFEFFTVVGETGMELVKVRFPADRGIAGRALRERKTMVVNDVKACPDFYDDIDKQHGFTTRSIVAAPLISGDEIVGVLNAINKIGNKPFDKEDDQILTAIADEVALAVKNAKLFNYVVDSYCKIRQGQNSCQDCKRPLRSWTPCAKHMNL